MLVFLADFVGTVRYSDCFISAKIYREHFFFFNNSESNNKALAFFAIKKQLESFEKEKFSLR